MFGPLEIGTLAGVIYSICIHEAAHAYSADALGDPTPRALGRCTLNPVPHIQATPFATLGLPVMSFLFSGGTMMFGGGACPVNVAYLRNPRRDDIIVSAAGPLANLVLSALCVILAMIPFITPGDSVLLPLLLNLAVMNFLLFLFNLIPAPPLDGSRILVRLVPDAQRFYATLMSYGEMLPLVIALVLFRYVGSPIVWAYGDLVVGLVKDVRG
jgi:Zn-dependent protease